jgi:hypothetical protein
MRAAPQSGVYCGLWRQTESMFLYVWNGLATARRPRYSPLQRMVARWSWFIASRQGGKVVPAQSLPKLENVPRAPSGEMFAVEVGGMLE